MERGPGRGAAASRRGEARRAWLALAPALLVVGALFGTSLVYGALQSLGYLTIIGETGLSLEPYRNVLVGPSAASREFWPSLGFSLWVSGAATLVSAVGALALGLLLSRRRRPAGPAELGALNLNLAFPHLVWAIAILLLLGQSGLVARVAHALGLIGAPAEFPVLVRDRWGLGIILAYVGKELPFLTLVVLAVLRTQSADYDLVAENLGASPWQRLRHVTLPLALPALGGASLLVFAFVLGAYEVPAVLGVRFPRMLAVLGLDLFLNPDLRARAEGMAVSAIMTAVVLLVALVGRARAEG
ncbi:MAG TPA: ABC transporter permease subunit [Chloroflexaceae bacterium]|nr:ABC transporter permease subunit [Chloroflexaceae bacterium]